MDGLGLFLNCRTGVLFLLRELDRLVRRCILAVFLFHRMSLTLGYMPSLSQHSFLASASCNRVIGERGVGLLLTYFLFLFFLCFYSYPCLYKEKVSLGGMGFVEGTGLERKEKTQSSSRVVLDSKRECVGRTSSCIADALQKEFQ